MKQKNPGEDSVCSEILEVEGKETETVQKTCNTVEVQEVWKTSVIRKLPKRGTLRCSNNWRGLTLLPTNNKLFSMIVLKKGTAPITDQLPSMVRTFKTFNNLHALEIR